MVSTFPKPLEKRVVNLFKAICRDIPRFKIMYNLDQTVPELRHLVMLMFRKNGNVRDPRVIELLALKGEMYYEEIKNNWSQRGHVLTLLESGMMDYEPTFNEKFGIKPLKSSDLAENPRRLE